MLHEVTDSEGEPEDELEERFHDCFEDKDKVIASIAIMRNLEMRILLGGSSTHSQCQKSNC